MLKDLFEYEILVDAEGRCENYTIHGYVAADHHYIAESYITKKFKEDGEKVIKVKVTRSIGLVDIAV